jgi:hypothetical protein
MSKKEKIVGIALIIIGLVLNFSIEFPAVGFIAVAVCAMESDCCFKFKILKKRNNK